MKRLDVNLSRKPYLSLPLAAVLGVGAGGLVILFIKILKNAQQYVWTTLPKTLNVQQHPNRYTLAVCLIGGLLVGLASKYLGDYPKEMSEALRDFKKNGSFDYKHLPQATVGALTSLIFGASLGPEAGLVSIIGGLCSWINKQLRIVEGKSKFWKYAPGLVAAAAGIWAFKRTTEGSYFTFIYLPYIFKAHDVLIALLPAVVGAAVGLLLLVGNQYFDKLLKPFSKQFLAKAVIGGLVLGLLASRSSLVLFSGHEGIETILTTVNTGQFLISIGLTKVFMAALLLATGWKGGKFFPTMFAGAAVGLGLAHFVTAVPPMVGLAAGLAAAIGALLQKPWLAAGFALLFFPVPLWAVVILGALLGARIGQQATKRYPQVFAEVPTN